MFIFSKIFWLLFDPATLFLLVLLAGTGLLWTRRYRLGRWIVATAAAFALVAAILPINGWLIQPLENRFPTVKTLPERVDGVISLGGVVNQYLTVARDQVTLSSGAERLTAFITLARRYPDARLVFSGGSASLIYPDLKETLVVRRLLNDIGFNTDRVLFEGESRNTHENAVLTHALVKPQPGETWLLITSAMHMPRAVGAFRKAGWKIVPYPVDFITDGSVGMELQFNVWAGLGGISRAAHEWVGLLAYRLLGRSDAIFPAPDE